jgi:hypothetical protein
MNSTGDKRVLLMLLSIVVVIAVIATIWEYAM